MATREENLKKINDELEKLDDEELEKVAGGILVMNSMSVSDPKKDSVVNIENQGQVINQKMIF